MGTNGEVGTVYKSDRARLTIRARRPISGRNKSPRPHVFFMTKFEIFSVISRPRPQSPRQAPGAVPRTVQAASLYICFPLCTRQMPQIHRSTKIAGPDGPRHDRQQCAPPHNARNKEHRQGSTTPVQAVRSRSSNNVVHHSWPSRSPLGHRGPTYFHDARSAGPHLNSRQQRQLNYVDPTHHGAQCAVLRTQVHSENSDF